jgi:CheY-like chemotaxis protein
MDGFAVVKELKRKQQDYPNIPILIISSVREESSHRRYELEVGHRLEVDDYIEKPIEPFVLLAHVERLLGKGGKDARPD